MDDAQGEWKEELHQSLVPGIQDEITLDKIVTKFSWVTLLALSQVSRSWRRALHSRQVHDARVRTGSTQTFVPMMVEDPRKPCSWRDATVCLYDAIRDKWHLLPPIPDVVSGIPRGCEIVCMMGKLYILGGMQNRSNSKLESLSGKEVHVLDLAAGGTEWKRLADMTFSRAYFPCEHQNGKVYVFGGLAIHTRKRLAEVEYYDPELNTWHVVSPMKTGMYRNVTTAGNKFYLYSSVEPAGSDDSHAIEYDPQKDQWTKLKHFEQGNCKEAFLEVDGRVHKIDLNMTYVQDDLLKWVPCQNISWQQIRSPEEISLIAVVVVSGELLVLAKLESSTNLILFRSKWFGRKNSEIVFDQTVCPYRFVYWQGYLGSIKL